MITAYHTKIIMITSNNDTTYTEGVSFANTQYRQQAFDQSQDPQKFYYH